MTRRKGEVMIVPAAVASWSAAVRALAPWSCSTKRGTMSPAMALVAGRELGGAMYLRVACGDCERIIALPIIPGRPGRRLQMEGGAVPSSAASADRIIK